MPDPTRGTDHAGRRSKRFLTPLQKYEIYLQLVRHEATMAEAAERWQVDRSTIDHAHPHGGQGGRLGGAGQVPAWRQGGAETSSWRRPGPMPLVWARRSRRWR